MKIMQTKYHNGIVIMDLSILAKSIITKNQYLVLGTVGENGAWISPVAYVYDDKWNFYFVSLPASKHCTNLSKNNRASFAIYDSHQDWGEGIGLQIEGTVEKVQLTELPKATALYFSRKYPYRTITNTFAIGLKKLLNNQTYSFYKITPSKFWINNPDADVDERVEVKLQ